MLLVMCMSLNRDAMYVVLIVHLPEWWQINTTPEEQVNNVGSETSENTVPWWTEATE